MLRLPGYKNGSVFVQKEKLWGPATNEMALNEFSIMHLEAELATAVEKVEWFADMLREDCYNGDAECEAQWDRWHDRQEKIEAELTRRYKKVREVVESDLFANMSPHGLRKHLDMAHAKRADLDDVMPRPESYHEDHVEIECRITGLWFLLTHAQLASVSTSPNTE